MRTQSENKQTAWSAGKREWPRRWCFKSGIWLVEVVTRVSKTNDGATKCETKIFRKTVDIELETAAVTGLKNGCNFALHRFNFQSDWPPHLSYQSIHFPWGVYVSISQSGWLRIDKKIEWDNSFHPTNLINEFTFRRSGNSLNVIKLHFLRLNQFF